MWRLLFVLLVCGVCACGNESAQQESGIGASTPSDSHQKMVDTLAALARTANPMDFYHLNTKRAKLIGAQLSANTNPGMQAQLSYQYANELLSSGQLDIAISLLRQLTSQLPLAKNSKPFYDLLALAHLRKGEVDNCLSNHNEESCILPIIGGGKHLNSAGSEEAIRQYTAILNAFPDDDQSRYLLNLAYQTLGSKPPAAFQIKEMNSASAKRQFVDVAGHGGLGVNRLSGGVALGDFNGDGYTDIFASSSGFDDDAQLFVSQTEGGFAHAKTNLQ